MRWSISIAGYASSVVAADFASLVSLACHDLRTPLATVSGFAKTLLRLEHARRREGGPLPRADRRRLDRARRAARAALARGADRERTLRPGRRARPTRSTLARAAVPEATGEGATVQVDVEAVRACDRLARPRGAAPRRRRRRVRVVGADRRDRAGRRGRRAGRPRRGAEGSRGCGRRSRSCERSAARWRSKASGCSSRCRPDRLRAARDQTSAVPSSTTVPSWFVIVVRSRVIGLSSRTSSTSTSAVISSPGRTGALKLQSTCRKTLPGPGRSSATTAFSSPEVTPPWTTIPPKRVRAAAASS